MTQETPSSDRRPIKARDTAWARAITAALIRGEVSPRDISASTIVFGVLGGLAFAATTRVDSPLAIAALFLTAALCMQLRLLANLFDGMVALGNGKPIDPAGALWNEVPDRVADACFFIGAGYAFGGNVMLGCIAALLAVFTAYVRAQGVALGARDDFRGPMAKPHRMALLTAAAVIAAVMPRRVHQSLHELLHESLLEWLQLPHTNPVGIVAAALLIIALGCVVTCVRRLRGIATELDKRRGNAR